MNRQLSLRINMLKFKTAWKLPIILEESMEYAPQFNKGKPEDVNMQPVGLANTRISTDSMIRENRQLVTDGSVEVQQDFRRITDHFRGIYGIYPKEYRENRRMWTCGWLDLQTLGSRPIMPKILPGHCAVLIHKCITNIRMHWVMYWKVWNIQPYYLIY